MLRVAMPFMEPLTRYVEPASAYIPVGWHIVSNVYERLVETVRDDEGGFKVVPSLAEAWEVSDDGLVYTFTLREGAKFASGRPVIAEAVSSSLERVLKVGEAPARYLPMRETRATGDRTVEVTLSRPSSTLLLALASPIGSVVDMPAVPMGNDWGHRWLSLHSASSGPFEVTEMSDARAVLRGVSGHRKGAPSPGEIVLEDIPDPVEQRRALEEGRIDMALGLSPQDFAELAADPRFAGYAEPSLGCPHVSVLAGSKGPDGQLLTHNRSFVQAIKYALDYDAYAMMYGGWSGLVQKCQTGVLPGMVGYDEGLASHYEYDAEKARKLLAEAGFPSGLELTFPYWEGFWGGVDADVIAKQVQADLLNIGIATKLQKLTSTDYFDAPAGSLNGITISLSASQFPDPDDVLRRKMTWTQANSGYDFGAGESFDRAAAESDPEARAGIYKALQRQYLEEGSAVFLLTFPFNVATTSNVSGFTYPVMWNGPNYHGMTKS